MDGYSADTSEAMMSSASEHSGQRAQTGPKRDLQRCAQGAAKTRFQSATERVQNLLRAGSPATE